MLKDVVEVIAGAPYRLRLVFEDGLAGEVDVADLVPFTGVFEPLRDPSVFGQARVDADLGTVVWPNGADLDPDVLYARVSGEAIPADLTGATGGRPYAGNAQDSAASGVAEAADRTSWTGKNPKGCADRDESAG